MPNTYPVSESERAEYIKMAEAFEAEHPDYHVPFSCPFILPAEWVCLRRDANNAAYRRRNGLSVIMSSTRELDGKHWLHVSLSYPNRLPSYEDMAFCKKLFIGKDRTAYQIFPDEAHHVNIHPFVLHLWACVDGPVTPDFTRGLGAI